MLELKRPLNGLKNNIYDYQDISVYADNTFKITDLPDKFFLGKNYFKLHLKDDILVPKSQVYIDIIDGFGNPVYYKILSDNLPNKERIVVVYIYDTTPVGDCEIIIAGRLLKNPNTSETISFSNEVSSPDYHGIPNVVWRKVIQINPEEVDNTIYYSIPPTVTYSEVRKPLYTLQTEQRLVTTYATASSVATLYSNRGQVLSLGSIKEKPVKLDGHYIPQSSSSLTFVPITSINNEDEISSLYFTGFDLSSSMEGGRIYFNNISYSYPKDAQITQSKILNYSASILKVVNNNTCYVVPPFYHILNYTDSNGNTKKLVLDGFRESRNFTASYYKKVNTVENTSIQNSYIKLNIINAEPEIGSVKSINVRAKSINKPGEFTDLGVYDVLKRNVMILTSSYKVNQDGISAISLGDFRELGSPMTYWTGSDTTGEEVGFTIDNNIINGVIFPRRVVYDYITDYSEFYLLPEYQPTVYEGTEYELTFDLFYPRAIGLPGPRQVDIFISGSDIDTNTEVQTKTSLLPLKSPKFGTYIGSVDAGETNRHSPSFYFKVNKTGKITPRFVHRSTGAVYGNMKLSVRSNKGYSPRNIELEVPLPAEFNSRSELVIELDYYNSSDDKANYTTRLHGVVFEGNTPLTGSSSSSGSIVLPSGLISSSHQINELIPNIISSSAQIGPTGIYSGSGIVPNGTSALSLFEDDPTRQIRYLFSLPGLYQQLSDGFNQTGIESVDLGTEDYSFAGFQGHGDHAAYRIQSSNLITNNYSLFYLSSNVCRIGSSDMQIEHGGFINYFKNNGDIGFGGIPSRAKVVIKGTTSTQGSASFVVQNSSNNPLFVVENNKNIGINGSGSYGSGSGVVFIGEVVTPPTNRPKNGALLYVHSGSLRAMGTGSQGMDVVLSGSFSGSFSGNGNNIIGVVTSSYALTASYALIPSGTFGWYQGTTDGNGLLTVNHRLGIVPQAVLLTMSGLDFYTANVTSKTATTFTAIFFDSSLSEAKSTLLSFNWLVR